MVALPLKMFSRILIATLIVALAFPASLFAQETDNSPRELRYNLARDLVITGVTAAGYIGTSVFEKDLAPDNCRWCSSNAFDNWGHENLKWSTTDAAVKTSHVTAFVLAPLAAFGLDALAAYDAGGISGVPIDALIIAEATASAAMFTQIVKFAAGRERPSVHYLTPDQRAASSNHDDDTSFFSGHTSIAFALAASSGTVATMRGYRLAPLIWGAGMAVAATTGYLRVAADKHYLTDVITGAAIGSAFGVGLPYLLHRPSKANELLSSISAVPTDGGVFVSFRKTL